MPAVATAQAERTITPEDIDSYVAEFQQDPDVTPVVDGVGGISDSELAAYHEMVRATQAVGDPETELVPGQMWSDTVGLPAGVDKTDADAAEIAIALEQDTPPSIDSLETLGTLDSMAMAPTSTHCRTFLFSPHQVCGAILARYEALGGQFGWLMHPIEPMHLNPDGQGYRQRFHNGFIYWHPETGAHAVTTRSAVLWDRHGWEQGWLGYPLGGEVPVKGTTPIDGELNGWVQIFQGGRIYRSPLQQVASINGAILDKWLHLGGPDSDLGFPIADEAKTADGIGRFSVFQHGSTYWHPHHGAHPVSDLLYEAWAIHGFESGKFGYPTSGPLLNHDQSVKQHFADLTMDLNEEIDTSGTVQIGPLSINTLFHNQLIRLGVSPHEFQDLTWSVDNASEPAEVSTFQTTQQSGLPPWAACGINDEGKVVRTWMGSRGAHYAKTVSLTCGKRDGTGAGYFHIANRHGKEWQALASIEGIGWRNLADLAMTKSITNPNYWKNSTERGSTCYSGRIYLENRRTRTTAKTLNPSIIVSNNNDIVITAFPGGRCATH